jgi:hypothetical protein
MKKLVLAAVAAFLLAAPAYATHCPTLMKKIDDALPTAKVSDADKAEITALRKKGEEEHKAAKHSDSIATLNAALKKLGM